MPARFLRTLLVSALLCTLAGAQTTTQSTLRNPPPDADRTLLVTLGLGDRSQVDWSGSAAVESGAIIDLIGYEMGVGDLIEPPNAWTMQTRPAFPFSRRPHDEGILVDLPPNTYLTPRFHLYLKGSEATRVRVVTRQGEFAFALSEIPAAGEKSFLGGRAKVQDSAAPILLGRGDTGPASRRLTDNDFPSLTVARDGSIWAAWQGFDGESADRVYAERIGPGAGVGPATAPHAVSPADGDVYRTAVAEDAEGKIWVVWSEQRNENWDLYGRSFDGESWSREQRLTQASQPDAQHKLIADSKGRLTLIWQGYRNNRAAIHAMRYEAEGGWSEETVVSDSGANCWEPSIAVDSNDNLFAAYDCYGPNGYDVFLAEYRPDGGWRKPMTVAATGRFEAYATVAVDAGDRPWIAWHESGVNWGKDYGHPYDIRANGTGLYVSREIRMAVLDGGRLQAPAQRLADSLPDPGPGNNFYEYPQLAADASGRVWCFFRHRRPAQHNVYARTPLHHALWEIYASYYEGGQWSPMTLIPYSTGRTDMRIEVARDPRGGLAAVWPTDRRNFRDFVNMLPDVFTARLPKLPGQAPAPRLAAFQLPPLEPALQAPQLPRREVAANEPVHPNETQDVQRIREYAYEIGDRRYRIHRGDMHRHTEISWDGYNDGSLEDTYRYAVDAASLDFIAITEHNFGVDDEYDWWRSQKYTDIHRVGRTFVPLVGYERSIPYPNGHRNVVFPYRGAPVLDYQHYEWNSGQANFAYTREGPERFFAYLRKYKAVAMPHTTGTSMGTDWADYDPEVEPIVEIYQSDRTSYECTDCWRATPPDIPREQNGGYKPDGYVNVAWNKGFRLGVQASSDHLGVHTAYSMILAEENTRTALVDGIRQRHTYGATDNIIVDFRLLDGPREYLMGDDATISGAPQLRVHIEGTDLLGEVEIVKNNRRVYRQAPDAKVADFVYRDNEPPAPGETAFYYVRVRQKDRDQQIAWSSPIWATRK
ncbi:MAG: hypothetical protein GC160_21195 [Acidobacteria bacterium]|nr:hypothetical protein [Acidobacteriota bacterium]